VLVWNEFLRHFRLCDEKDSGLSDEGQKRKGQKTAQSTHENEYIKPRKTFWRNSKQLNKLHIKSAANPKNKRKKSANHLHI